MSDYRRPAERMAETVNLPELAGFVKMRQLVLAVDPETIKQVEAEAGCTQYEALQYFLHVYPWEPVVAKTLATLPASIEKEQVVRTALASTLHHPIIRPRPEA
jgi:hypothetical protein